MTGRARTQCPFHAQGQVGDHARGHLRGHGGQRSREGRQIALTRTGVRLNRRHLAELATAIGELLRAAQDHPDDGV